MTNGLPTLKTSEGVLTFYGGKKQLWPAVMQHPGASRAMADKIMPLYQSLPLNYKNAAGPVAFYASGTIGELRKFSRNYDLPDQMVGRAFVQDSGPGKGVCTISLVEKDVGDIDEYLRHVMAHELAHCIDFRNRTTTRDDLLRAFYKDVTDETKPIIVSHDNGHYAESAIEAFAEAMAYFVTPVPDEMAETWAKDFPNVNSVVSKMLSDIGVRPIAYGAQPTTVSAPAAAASTVDMRPTVCATQVGADPAAYAKCMGGT